MEIHIKDRKLQLNFGLAVFSAAGNRTNLTAFVPL